MDQTYTLLIIITISTVLIWSKLLEKFSILQNVWNVLQHVWRLYTWSILSSHLRMTQSTSNGIVYYYVQQITNWYWSSEFKLCRIEITRTSTDNVKWDGQGLPVRNQLAASLVSEFADDINVGTLSKKISDEVKITSNARNVVDQNAAFCNKHDHAKVYCLLYYGTQILFYSSVTSFSEKGLY